MKKFIVSLSILLSIFSYSLFSYANHGPYDPERDPFKDFEDAQTEASRDNKFILITVGGNWCSWCIKLERFFDKSPELKALRDEVFVSMKVNVSTENYNESFLSQMPEFEGFPFIIVTNQHGEVLNSLTSGNLEQGNGYSESKFREYFEHWQGVDSQAGSELFK
jgi:thioredoxin-related protein